MGIWRLIEDIPRSGSFNMAADLMLLNNYSQDDYPVFRIYDWECPTLSIGRNEYLTVELIWICVRVLKFLLFGEQQVGKLFCMDLTSHIHWLEECWINNSQEVCWTTIATWQKDLAAFFNGWVLVLIYRNGPFGRKIGIHISALWIHLLMKYWLKGEKLLVVRNV